MARCPTAKTTERQTTMNHDTNSNPGDDLLSRTLATIEQDQSEELASSVAGLSDAELANLVESLPPEQRAVLWLSCPADRHGELLVHLHEEVRSGLIDNMAQATLVSAVQVLDEEDAAEVIEDLSDDVSETILDLLDADNRSRVEKVLSYEQGSAGRLMSRNLLLSLIHISEPTRPY